MAALSRKFVPTLAAGALVLAGAAYGVTKYRNIPGPVTGSYAGGIAGTFHLQSAASGLASNGYGGACLIFRARDVGLDWMEKKHCTKDSDCSKPGSDIGGYCEEQTKKCWAKPIAPSLDDADSMVCLRRPEIPGGAPLTPGQTMTIPVSHANLVKMKIAPNAKVRVLTCLNGIPGGGCRGNGNPARHEWGTPRQL